MAHSLLADGSNVTQYFLLEAAGEINDTSVAKYRSRTTVVLGKAPVDTNADITAASDDKSSRPTDKRSVKTASPNSSATVISVKPSSKSWNTLQTKNSSEKLNAPPLSAPLHPVKSFSPVAASSAPVSGMYGTSRSTAADQQLFSDLKRELLTDYRVIQRGRSLGSNQVVPANPDLRSPPADPPIADRPQIVYSRTYIPGQTVPPTAVRDYSSYPEPARNYHRPNSTVSQQRAILRPNSIDVVIEEHSASNAYSSPDAASAQRTTLSASSTNMLYVGSSSSNGVANDAAAQQQRRRLSNVNKPPSPFVPFKRELSEANSMSLSERKKLLQNGLAADAGLLEASAAPTAQRRPMSVREPVAVYNAAPLQSQKSEDNDWVKSKLAGQELRISTSRTDTDSMGASSQSKPSSSDWSGDKKWRSSGEQLVQREIRDLEEREMELRQRRQTGSTRRGSDELVAPLSAQAVSSVASAANNFDYQPATVEPTYSYYEPPQNGVKYRQQTSFYRSGDEQATNENTGTAGTARVYSTKATFENTAIRAPAARPAVSVQVVDAQRVKQLEVIRRMSTEPRLIIEDRSGLVEEAAPAAKVEPAANRRTISVTSNQPARPAAQPHNIVPVFESAPVAPEQHMSRTLREIELEREREENWRRERQANFPAQSLLAPPTRATIMLSSPVEIEVDIEEQPIQRSNNQRVQSAMGVSPPPAAPNQSHRIPVRSSNGMYSRSVSNGVPIGEGLLSVATATNQKSGRGEAADGAEAKKVWAGTASGGILMSRVEPTPLSPGAEGRVPGRPLIRASLTNEVLNDPRSRRALNPSNRFDDELLS